MPPVCLFAAHALLEADAVCRKIMAEAMQTDSFPVLPSGLAEGMTSGSSKRMHMLVENRVNAPSSRPGDCSG